MLRRPRRDPLAQVEPDMATSMAPTTSGTARAPGAPTTRRLSPAGTRESDQELTGIFHWLADVETRFDGKHDVSVNASVGNSGHASNPDPQVATERKLVGALATVSNDGDHPKESVHPGEDHWLAGVEAAFERGIVSEETPRATDCPTTREAAAATVGLPAPENVPAPRQTRVAMDEWFDDMEEKVLPLQGPGADARGDVERRG